MAVVLAVDDDPLVLRAVARLVEGAGHASLTAESVDEARAALREAHVDVVVCDVNLPGESGLDLVREMARDLPDTAVFMLTGVDDPAIAEEALALGATAYVVKPFLPSEIVINVANSLRLRNLERHRRVELDDLERKLVGRSRALRGAIRVFDDDGGRGAAAEHDVVEKLAAALALRDDETGGHIERMSRYTSVLARRRGVDAWSDDAIRHASMLHDVGKIGIPDHILLKAGPLDEREFEEIKRHPGLGYQLLADSESSVVRLGATIALTHHERWDGTGYPRHLAGEDIPLEGRIAAVADVFDAVTSNRVYRPAMEVEVAIDLIREGRERHFDPEIVDLFLVSIDEMLATKAEFPDPEDVEAISVLVVDDHVMFADCVTRILGREPGLRFVGVASTADVALEAARRHRPDVILMDWELEEGDGLSATRAIRAELPETKVVLVTGRTDDAVLLEALKAGCCDFLTKHQTFDHLVDVIRSAHAGESTLPAGRVITLLAQLHPDQQGQAATLSPREVEVLDFVARGLQVAAIADRLILSTHTVRNHIQNAMAKLDAHSRLEAVTAAARQGIIRLT